MFSWLFRPLRYLAQALVDDDHPKQLAWGIAIGVIVGLLPKGNLTAVFFGVLLFSLRVNLAAGLGAALFVSGAAPLIDPLSDHLGRSLLSLLPLQETYAQLYQLPVVPWTQFNNTVVMGGVFLGLLQLYPTYRLMHSLAEKYHSRLVERLRKYRVTRVLLGAEFAAAQWRQS